MLLMLNSRMNCIGLQFSRALSIKFRNLSILAPVISPTCRAIAMTTERMKGLKAQQSV